LLGQFVMVYSCSRRNKNHYQYSGFVQREMSTISFSIKETDLWIIL
jgi:hypothetical protein